ncbi:tail fiber assembly protein [Pseudomonas fluorescens]|uniref:tail fiber assembly protein n=1 Tax=Pseudomonas fluorescens TaxID=294 RepID=UPI0010E9C9E2|nr:tail fiber assembly protein [Pseudomonas fluorescens]TCV57933.1 virus tail fiber assembly protein lambda gpK [Pseudomonas fluorescens]
MFYYLFDKSGALSGPVEFSVTPGIGVQIPSNAVEISFELPPPESGRTWALVNNVPREVIDHRGLVYRKEDGGQQVWSELGELPAAFTREPWPGNYHIWANQSWQFDVESQLNDVKTRVLAERDALLRDAVLRIAPLQYAEDIGDASDQEQLALMEWKLYSVELNRIQHQTGFPTDITWPVVPESAV